MRRCGSIPSGPLLGTPQNAKSSPAWAAEIVAHEEMRGMDRWRASPPARRRAVRLRPDGDAREPQLAEAAALRDELVGGAGQ